MLLYEIFNVDLAENYEGNMSFICIIFPQKNNEKQAVSNHPKSQNNPVPQAHS